MDHRLDHLEKGQEEISRQIDKNTLITTEVKSILQTGKIGAALIKWCAAVGAAGVAIWASIHFPK